MKKFLTVVIVFFSCLSYVQAQGWHVYIPASDDNLQSVVSCEKNLLIFGEYFAAKTPFTDQWDVLSAYGNIQHSAYLNGSVLVAGSEGLLNLSQDIGDSWVSLFNLSWSEDVVDIIIDNNYFIVLPYQYECATMFDPVSNTLDSLYLIPEYYVQKGFVVDHRIFVAYGNEIDETVLLFTDNLGSTWFSTDFPYVGTVVSAAVNNDVVVLAIVNNNDSKIIISNDGAMTWDVYQEFPNKELASVCLFDQDVCAVVNDGDTGFLYENGEILNMSFPRLNQIISSRDDDFDLIAVGEDGMILVRSRMVSIADFSADAPQVGFKAYPNPCVNYFTVDFGQDLLQPLSVCVYDLTGRVVYSNQVTDNFKVDLSSQPKGMYFIKIGNVTKKIMK